MTSAPLWAVWSQHTKKAVDVGDAESKDRREDGSKVADWVVVRHQQTSTPGRMHRVGQQGIVGR